MSRQNQQRSAQDPAWLGHWQQVAHTALYVEMFFNLDYDELGFDDPDELPNPNEIARQVHEEPLEALSDWASHVIVRAELDADPYEIGWREHELIYQIAAEHGLMDSDVEIILGRLPGESFRYFVPDAATQAAVLRSFGARRDAASEALDGPVHGYGARLSELRDAWLELRADGRFEAAMLLDYDEIVGSWRALPEERLQLEPDISALASRIVEVEFLGRELSVVTRSDSGVERRVYRREPPLPQLGPDPGEGAAEGSEAPMGVVSSAQWWAHLRTAPRRRPRPVRKRKQGRKQGRRPGPKGAKLVLRPEPAWLRTPTDYLALREGPWAASVVELDLSELELDSERDVKRVLGALSWPREPWPALERVRVLEGLLLEDIEPFMRASPVFAQVELVELS